MNVCCVRHLILNILNACVLLVGIKLYLLSAVEQTSHGKALYISRKLDSNNLIYLLVSLFYYCY